MYVAAKYSTADNSPRVMVEISHPDLLTYEDGCAWVWRPLEEGEQVEDFTYSSADGPAIVVLDNSQATLAKATATLRARRNDLLRATDVTQIREDFTTEQRTAWAAYRAELRTWPEDEADPINPTEPTPPDITLLGQMLSFIGL